MTFCTYIVSLIQQFLQILIKAPNSNFQMGKAVSQRHWLSFTVPAELHSVQVLGGRGWFNATFLVPQDQQAPNPDHQCKTKHSLGFSILYQWHRAIRGCVMTASRRETQWPPFPRCSLEWDAPWVSYLDLLSDILLCCFKNHLYFLHQAYRRKYRRKK